MGSPYIGDAVDLTIDGNDITAGRTVSGQPNTKIITAPATWGSPEVDIYGTTKYVYTVECVDMDDNSGTDFDTIVTVARTKTPVAVVIYPRGNVAGRKIISGNAYISEPIRNLSMDAATTYSFNISFTATPTETPNLALNVSSFGTCAVNVASNFTALSASGGTSTYTYAIQSGALPEGLSWSTNKPTGTPNANCGVGVYTFTIRVTDSAATPVVKDFPVTLTLTA